MDLQCVKISDCLGTPNHMTTVKSVSYVHLQIDLLVI